ncbi:MAG: 4-hydroxy-tetrahydrodipicolinate reductase [Spirochaetia bacterium]|nr:4-hydroxy-tetrahydrodipicolinate reductase [Spirochaetia bacterium]
MVRLGISGAAGRMGQALINVVLQNPQEYAIGMLLEAKANSMVGMSIGGFAVVDDIKAGTDNFDVFVDFSTPIATMNHLKELEFAGKPVVIGTTGLDQNDVFEIETMAKKIPIVMSSNYSVGINVMWKLLREATKILKDDYDIDIVESHHRMKKDAPSGTALTTAEVILKTKGLEPKGHMVFGREGKENKRDRDEIGVFAVRAGGIVGEHTVIFGSMGDKLEISHTAFSRDTLAIGALKAAKFVAGKKTGLYNMEQVLGL